MTPAMMRAILSIAVTTAITAFAGVAYSQAEPTGNHPRIWLDDDTLDALREKAADPESAVSKVIERCADARTNPDDYASGGYQGFIWAYTVSECALAWQINGNPEDAATALVYFNALLDDYETIGDAAGGDTVVRHDTGYAMRTFAPYSGLAYDWLHDAPGMTEELRSKARARFEAWTSWYATDGYMIHVPGANYNAGYVMAATLIAIAQGGEAGADGAALWSRVVDTVWGKDMAEGLAPGGVLEGGDWLEGWQYAPLSVIEYALASRAIQEQGVIIPGLGDWLGSLIVRHVYALTPQTLRTFALGDTGESDINLAPNLYTMLAVVAGDGAPPEATQWARAEIESLGLSNSDFLVFTALAEARAGETVEFPRGQVATFHLARGSRALYARSDWTPQAVWTVAQCAPMLRDHQHQDAGNIVITRGADDLIADPTPYGSLSTLTSNAPTVTSENLPDNYRPSQGPWGIDTGFAWALQTNSGVVAARCNWADAYRFQDTVQTDVALALRDYVMLPHGEDATAVVIDRVNTGDAGRPLLLRFRTPTTLSLNGDVARGTNGESTVMIQKVFATDGVSDVRAMPEGECWDATRGGCDAARFSGDEYRIEVAAAAPTAVHLIDVAAADAPVPGSTFTEEGDVRVLALDRSPRRFVVVYTVDPSGVGASLTYHAPGGSSTHVVLDAPTGSAGRVDATAVADAGNCIVTVTPREGDSGGFGGRPLVLAVSDVCELSEDAEQAPFEPPPGHDGDGIPPDGNGSPDSNSGDNASGNPDGRDGDALTGDGGSDDGCGCNTTRRNASTGLAQLASLVFMALVLVVGRRRRR